MNGWFMLDLLKIRKNIDVLDQEILELYEKRMALSNEVANYKIANGKNVLDRERELEKLERIDSLVINEENKQGAKELFMQIMAISRKLQYKLLASKKDEKTDLELGFKPIEEISDDSIKVVHQGTKGAYSYEAMINYFGEKVESYSVQTFREAMEDVRNNKATYAVLPIENSTAGIVNEVYDLLVEYDNYIVAETTLKIEHALMANNGAKLEDIKRVYSHPQALMQCSKFLEEHKEFEQISTLNTALSAKYVLDSKSNENAAIASEYAAKIFGLNILEDNINHSDTNTTRFLIIANKKEFIKNADKVSICIEVPHESGSLYNILSHFIYNKLNMTKIESRPIVGKNWEYRFIIDIEGNLRDASVKNALYGIRAEASSFKILGNYKK